jgi:two-component system, NtrC family, response regulator HydG
LGNWAGRSYDMAEWNSILIVSPDQRALEAISIDLTADGFKVVRAGSEVETSYCLQRTTSFAGAVIDLTYGERWLNLLEQISIRLAAKPIVALVPQTNLNLAVKALQCGAYDYLLKPVLMEEVSTSLINNLGRSFHQQIGAGRRNGWLRERLLQPASSLSTFMRERMQVLGILARTEAPLLIAGEPGVGKTFYSRVIHFLSSRRFEPVTFIECKNKTSGEVLLGLFGSGQGVLTHQQNGTVILENCFHLSLSVQNRLIAFWEEQEQAIPVVGGVRIIGTCRLLPEQKGFEGDVSPQFRERIATGVVELPTLAERKEDISTLADLFLLQFADLLELDRKFLSIKAVQKLVQMPWSQNLHQLRLICLKAWALAEGAEISEQEIQPVAVVSDKNRLQLDLPSLQLEQVEETLIGQALHQNFGNMSRTATTLGISRGTLYNKIRKYGLENPTKKSEVIS